MLTSHFSQIARGYDAVLSDVWGVVHNGIVATPVACAALKAFREQGGAVILITNAPRPGEAVLRQIAKMGVPADTYDGIVSSGDVTRGEMAQRPGQRVFHIGPERDLGIFEGLDATFTKTPDDADYVVCTGPFDDEVETPEEYRPLMQQLLARKLFMLCGNPDVVVERGDKLVYCAGAVADLYGSMGGDVLYAGKPYAPIYEMALAKAQAKRGEPIARERVLAIGDSIRTDIKGAAQFGVDALFVTAGIHAEELGPRDNPGIEALKKIFAENDVAPRASMRSLVW